MFSDLFYILHQNFEGKEKKDLNNKTVFFESAFHQFVHVNPLFDMMGLSGCFVLKDLNVDVCAAGPFAPCEPVRSSSLGFSRGLELKGARGAAG